MCRNGQGTARDYKKSMEWYTKAAEKGHVESQLGLAELYYNHHLAAAQKILKVYLRASTQTRVPAALRA
jgi:TPR repeat protein